MLPRRVNATGAAALLLAVLAAPDAHAVPPGTTVTAERVAEAGDRLLPGVQEAVKRGMRIEVVESQPMRWRRVYQTATEQYAAQVRLGPRGELQDYVAGLPFPNVKPDDDRAALKVMWNHAFGPWIADDAQSWSYQWQVGRLKPGEPMRVEAGQRDDVERSKFLRLVGRTTVPPIPALPEASTGVFSMELYGPTMPVFQTMIPSGPLLLHRHLDLREPDLWYWVASERKARRVSPKILYEATGDTVVDINSYWGFSAPLGSYTFRVLGERRMLGVLHAQGYPLAWCPGGGDFAPCDRWEERDSFVVEATATKPYDIYSKRVIVLDKHSWVVLASDLYDREGRLWKTYVNFWSYRPDARGRSDAEWGYQLGTTCVDLIENRALRSRLPGTRSLADAVEIESGLQASTFNPMALEHARE
jgi:hypothetical protein